MAEIYNFFGDIWDYLRETYWEVDFGSYRNFSLGGYGTSLAQIITAIMLGCILASAVMLYERRYLGGFIRKLLAVEAGNEESAKTLKELGYAKNGVLKMSLRSRDSAVRKLVRYTGEEHEDVSPVGEGAKPARQKMRDDIDFEAARFYIPADLRNRAAVRYEAKGTNLRSFLLTVVVCLVGGALIIQILPVFFRLIDNVMTWLG